MSEPKRHHFIPELILRNFADLNGRMWFHRPDFAGAVKSTATKNLFVEGELNTIVDESGVKDLRIESIFSNFESSAAQLFPQLISAARENGNLTMDDNSWNLWDHYFYYQMKRPPNAVSRMAHRVDVDEILKQSIADAKAQSGGLSPEQTLYVDNPENFEKIRKNALAAARIRRPEKFLHDMLKSCGLVIQVIVVPGHSFVIGDVAVVPPTPAFPRFFTVVAPDVALVQSYAARQIEVRHIADRAHIRAMNLAMVRASEVVAGSDPGLIKFLVARR